MNTPILLSNQCFCEVNSNNISLINYLSIQCPSWKNNATNANLNSLEKELTHAAIDSTKWFKNARKKSRNCMAINKIKFYNWK